MPGLGPGTRRCKACLDYKPAAPRASWRTHAGIGGGLRCKACANKPSAERRDCADCGVPRCCTKHGPDWLCLTCGDVATLRRGEIPPKRTKKLSAAVQRAQHLAYLEAQYAWRARVDVWVVPLSPRCSLRMLQLVLWRRFNVVAGVLLGPPKRAFPRSCGVRGCDPAELAWHFRDLVQNSTHYSFWPAGSAPVLVTGATAAALAQAKAHIPAADQCRLKAYPESLSEWMATQGWTRAGFNQNPVLECDLTRRAKGALQAAGLPALDAHRALGAAGVRADAFRALYVGRKP